MSKNAIFILIIFVGFCPTFSFAQIEKLKGVWISPFQDLVQIDDTTSHYHNYLCNKLLDQSNFYLSIYGDTLSFQNKYTTSRTNFDVVYIDRYDLKIVCLTDSVLILRPVSSFSKKFFQNRAELKFKRQEYAVDKTIVFEKLYFESSSCCDEVPKVKLQLNRSKMLSVSWKIISEDSGQIQSGKITGTLSDSLYEEFIGYLQRCNLRTLRFKDAGGSDGITSVLVINYNRQRKYLRSMFPTPIADDLIRYLETLHRRVKLVMSDGKRMLEE